MASRRARFTHNALVTQLHVRRSRGEMTEQQETVQDVSRTGVDVAS
ncbi:TPA: hypothetical protein N6791_005054 [Escherichia coli]|nr:hypothetical protein [Escherichia coli]EEZ9256756.1 hypothetical protein [Escherichia coli]EFF0757145.1 hypothetical protein [Escherichia coli]EFP2198673.1 hypothetical protein [Escherichia coli]EHX2565784.1 hypothetical protein [Escherichia coli]EIQ1876183.1 hypothetical protein [Escherichia coli]